MMNKKTNRWLIPVVAAVAMVAVCWRTIVRAQSQSGGQCAVPPSGMVGWWPGDGDANDIINGNNGALNDATFGPGEVGEAFNFDGTDDGVRVPASASLNVTSFTIDAWVFPTDLGRRPIVEYSPDSGHAGIHLWQSVTDVVPCTGSGAGSLYANLRDTSGGQHVICSASPVLTVSQWNHVAVTYDQPSGVAQLFANGAMVAQSTLGSYTPQTSTPLYFGERPPAASKEELPITPV